MLTMYTCNNPNPNVQDISSIQISILHELITSASLSSRLFQESLNGIHKLGRGMAHKINPVEKKHNVPHV